MSNADLLMAICGPVGRNLAKRPLTEVFGMNPAKQAPLFASEQVMDYAIHPQICAAKELYVRALQESMEKSACFSNPETVKAFLVGRLGHLDHEVFCCLWLDAQLRLIAFDETFHGTLTQTSVYPREIVRRGLELNAASVIFAHNHPSGDATPSRADETLTQSLKVALSLVDLRCVDHLVIADNTSISLAAQGRL